MPATFSTRFGNSIFGRLRVRTGNQDESTLRALARLQENVVEGVLHAAFASCPEVVQNALVRSPEVAAGAGGPRVGCSRPARAGPVRRRAALCRAIDSKLAVGGRLCARARSDLRFGRERHASERKDCARGVRLHGRGDDGSGVFESGRRRRRPSRRPNVEWGRGSLAELGRERCGGYWRCPSVWRSRRLRESDDVRRSGGLRQSNDIRRRRGFGERPVVGWSHRGLGAFWRFGIRRHAVRFRRCSVRFRRH